MTSGLPRFRVKLWAVDSAAGRGRGALKAIIEDAKDIGGSAYANTGGEFFMTLPYTHPYIDEIDPLLTHYEVSRFSGSAYVPIFAGLLDGVEISRDEAVVFGRDYLSLLETTISASNTSYTNTLIGTIISDQVTAARAEANSRVNFITVGTIEATTTTATMLTSYEPRLHFIAGAADILMADRSVRSIIAVEPRSSGTPAFTFYENKGSNKTDVRLEYGGNVTDFLKVGPYANFRTRIQAIGQKREGATILFSTQTYASETIRGWIAESAVFLDVVDQAALDNKTKRLARRLGNILNDSLMLRLGPNALAPWDGYDIGDSVSVRVVRNPRDAIAGWEGVDGIFTIWGLEWVGTTTGNEELFLDLRKQETA